jgi:hypothetical protein
MSDIYYNLKHDVYKNSVPYPGNKKKFIDEYVDEHIRDFVGTKEQIQERETQLSVEANDLFNEKREAYDDGEALAHKKFKNDLFEEYGVSNNPKREKAYAYAWNEGHAYGMYEVAVIFGRIVHLIID